MLDFVVAKNDKVVIPSKTNRKKQREWDKHPCRNRHLIERCFTHIKQIRRIATRYDKRASRFA
ncbi:MAG: transposase [Glaciimonas sp.]|nr:transposase [Glaciimonas sp.]